MKLSGEVGIWEYNSGFWNWIWRMKWEPATKEVQSQKQINCRERDGKPGSGRGKVAKAGIGI